MTTRRKRWLGHLAAALAVLVAVLVPVPAATAADAGQLSPCPYGTGSYWCQVVVKDVTSTRFGTGKRVYLTGVVSASTDTTMTLSEPHWSSACSPDAWGCGATIRTWFDPVTVTTPSWTGDRRPPVGYVVRLYGTTTTGSLKPVGYVKTVYCGADYNLCW